MNEKVRVTVVDRRCEASVYDRRCSLPAITEEHGRWLCELHMEAP